jgi:hypothetical protein
LNRTKQHVVVWALIYFHSSYNATSPGEALFWELCGISKMKSDKFQFFFFIRDLAVSQWRFFESPNSVTNPFRLWLVLSVQGQCLRLGKLHPNALFVPVVRRWFLFHLASPDKKLEAISTHELGKNWEIQSNSCFPKFKEKKKFRPSVCIVRVFQVLGFTLG